jgi:hypothetical protein
LAAGSTVPVLRVAGAGVPPSLWLMMRNGGTILAAVPIRAWALFATRQA